MRAAACASLAARAATPCASSPSLEEGAPSSNARPAALAAPCLGLGLGFGFGFGLGLGFG